MPTFLDTHAWVWWVTEDPRLPPKIAAGIQRTARSEGVWLSAISIWEVANLHERGRVRFDQPLRDWLEQATAPPLVTRMRISPSVAAEVAALPPSFHRDPADRIIVATARVLGADLLTNDTRIIESGVVPTIS